MCLTVLRGDVSIWIELGTGATLKRNQNVVNNRKRIDGLAANVNDQNHK